MTDGEEAQEVPRGEALRRLLAANLGAFVRREAALVPGGRAAAVNVCVLDIDRDPQVLVAKRVSRGFNARQWALPGGRLEPGETAVQAALRELEEEVGIVARESDVVGLLDDFPATSGHRITPVVVCVDGDVEPRRNPDELQSLHRVSLRRLLSDEVPRWRVLEDGTRLLQMPLRHDMVVHAPTGAILYQFREVAVLGRETRVAGLAEPHFTRL